MRTLTLKTKMAKSKNEVQREYAKRSGYAANKKYLKEHGRRVTVCLTTPSDDDILAKLETVESKSGYIKQLIRADIAAGHNE